MKALNYISILLIMMLFPFGFAHAEGNSASAISFIDTNAKKVINILENSNSKTKKNALTTLFLSIMDYEWMGKFVIGKYWNSLSASEQEEYQKAYKDYLVSIYVPKYTEYNKNSFEIYATSMLGNNQYIVSMNIKSNSNSSSPVKVEYRVKDYGDSFKVRDIIAEDISLITTQRSDFTAFLSNKSIEDLIKNLDSKVTKPTD